MVPVSLIKSLGAHVLLFLARVLTNITKRLPLRVNRFLGRRLGNMLYFLLRRTRRIGWDNLDLVYGDTLSRKQKARILREAMENIGIVAAEFGHLEKIDDAFIDKDYSQSEMKKFHVVTTWHNGEPPEEVAWFFVHNTSFDDHDFRKFLVLVLGDDLSVGDRLFEMVRHEAATWRAV